MAASAYTSSADGQQWSSPIIISDDSNPSLQHAAPLCFKARLFSDYKQRVILPELPTLPQGTRWIIIEAEQHRIYKVEMVDDGGGFALERGWSLVAAIENLQEHQVLQFEELQENCFRMATDRPLHHPLPIGFSPARNQAHALQIGPKQMIRNQKTPLTPSVLDAVSQIWQASSDDSPVYICRLLVSASQGKWLMFNKEYARTIFRNHGNVAMRFIGSDVVIPGTLKTYTDGTARLVKEWHLYAEEHKLTFGQVFVCKIFRGPTVCEFIGVSAAE